MVDGKGTMKLLATLASIFISLASFGDDFPRNINVGKEDGEVVVTVECYPHYNYDTESSIEWDSRQYIADSPESLAILWKDVCETLLQTSSFTGSEILIPDDRKIVQLFAESFPTNQINREEFKLLLEEVNSDDFKVRCAAKLRAKNNLLRFFFLAKECRSKKLTPEQWSLIDIVIGDNLLSNEDVELLKDNKPYLYWCSRSTNEKLASLAKAKLEQGIP
jgi:hypothetical protein